MCKITLWKEIWDSDGVHSYLHSLPIKEYQIVDFFLPKLKDEVMKVRSPHIFFGECPSSSRILE
jgi:hypothetical protein